MSMKDAIFGTAAPSSHGGATYRDSIQAWLPVKNIIGGVVITKDNRFIKILEVLPVNFYLKSPSDQQNIITSYAAYLKIAPDSMSCEVRTLPPDTSEYVEQMRQFQKTEESENCRAEIEDNIEKIGLGIARFHYRGAHQRQPGRGARARGGREGLRGPHHHAGLLLGGAPAHHGALRGRGDLRQ